MEICSKPLAQMPPWPAPQSEDNDEMSLAGCITARGGQQWTQIITAFFDPMLRCIFGCWDLAYCSYFSIRDMSRRIPSP